jgi:hypothetical protein
MIQLETQPLKEIRDIRRQISKECGDNPEKVFAYYLTHQQKMKASGEYTFVNGRSASKSAAIATEQNHTPKPDLQGFPEGQ